LFHFLFTQFWHSLNQLNQQIAPNLTQREKAQRENARFYLSGPAAANPTIRATILASPQKHTRFQKSCPPSSAGLTCGSKRRSNVFQGTSPHRINARGFLALTGQAALADA
jgi:hypothetical protein